MTLLGPYHRGKTESDENLQALVLAAGQSHRFGGDKLHALYRGRPLLSHVLTVVETACSQGLLRGGTAVIGDKDEEALALVRAAGLDPVVNDAPELGLAHSLRLGLAALESSTTGNAAAAVIFLGDQPLVRLEVVEQLVNAWHQSKVAVVRPRYEAQAKSPGHPVILARRLWPRARRLEGDVGLRAQLGSSPTDLITVDVPGDNPDVDTLADLRALENSR